MKVSRTAFAVIASSAPALASWTDWYDPDITVTATLTKTHAYCPCNGEVQVAPVTSGGAWEIYTTQTGGIGPDYTATTTTVPGKTITKAGPVVVVFETGGAMTTKTGIALELVIDPVTEGGSTSTVTKTVWTGAQPTDDLAWVDWDDDNAEDGATLTRSHTAYTTVYDPVGSVPTTASDYESWADWAATSNEATVGESSTSSGGNGVGPIGASTTTSSSYSNGVGPIGASTTTSSSSSMSTSSTSSGSNGVGPIGASTTTSSSSTTTSTGSNGVGPIGASTTTTSSLKSSSSKAAVSSSSSSSKAAVTSSSSTFKAAVTSSSSSSAAAASSSSSSKAAASSSSSSKAAASTTTTASGRLPTTTDDVSGDTYINGILEAHNVHRANHSAADLTWSTEMATYASEAAATCTYAHNLNPGGGGYGQNIGAGYDDNQVPAMIGNDMYNAEMPKYPTPYGLNNPDTSDFSEWGHFSQIVWKTTTQVGCATQYCTTLDGATFTHYFTVCNYYPAGNVQGEYAYVGAPLGHDVVFMKTGS